MLLGFNTLTLYAAGAPADVWRRVAERADELGFESLWMGHHMVFPPEISRDYPYTPDGSSPLRPEMQRLDPWVLYAHLAGVTERLRFGTAVYLLPLINPFVTARAVATADYLSSGRFLFGVGVGWNRQEYEILGEDFSTRGARCDEILEILRRLWTDDVPEFRGRHYDFGPVRFEPKPHRPGGPPILYGGLTEAALARAARLDGCFLPTNDLGEVERAASTIRAHREAAGLTDLPYDLTAVSPFPLTPEAVVPFRELGVNRLTFEVGHAPHRAGNPSVGADLAAVVRNLEEVADEVLAAIA